MNRFSICEGHALLENHFNVGGVVWERPSNRRRNESTGCQLNRMKYRDPYAPGLKDADKDVQEVYLTNVVKWKLPLDEELATMVREFFTPEFLRENDSPAVQNPEGL